MTLPTYALGFRCHAIYDGRFVRLKSIGITFQLKKSWLHNEKKENIPSTYPFLKPPDCAQPPKGQFFDENKSFAKVPDLERESMITWGSSCLSVS